jgi:hypothetical protein
MSAVEEPVPIPSSRLKPSSHLARAAKSDLGSEAERYHLAAATAEALSRIEETLHVIARLLAEREVKP